MQESQLREIIQELEKEVFNLRIKKNEIKIQVDVLHSEISFSETRHLKLKNEINKLEQWKAELLWNNTKLETKQAKIIKNITNIEQKLAILHENLNKCDITSENLKHDISILKQNKITISEEVKSLSKQKNDLLDEKIEILSFYNIKKQDLINLEWKISSANTKLKSLGEKEEILTKWEARLQRTEKRLNNLKKDLLSKK